MSVKMSRENGIYVTAERDYAVMNDCRNWWIVVPIINDEVQYGSLDSTHINGTYQDAVNHITTIRKTQETP
jgi:hypothetical protein